ncbi:hypothetical protein [Lentzea sp. E54]|uniref:hypothetical protein n=1 Tax=Lentzea xerophila TaxID=3435883 RepID=UPI003DA46C5D
MARKKLSPVLLLPEDEVALQAAITAAHPDVRILDSGPWADADTPPVLGSVLEARSIAYVWPTSLHPVLPVEVRSNGAVWGVETGKALQWRRGRVVDGTLSAGTLGVVVEPELEEFVRSVWRILSRLTSNDLVRYHRPTGEHVRTPTYRVGPHALAEARAGRLRLMDAALVLHPAG